MADIISLIAKMNDIELASDAPVTEAVMAKEGASINGLIDANTAVLASLAGRNGVAASYPSSTGVGTLLTFAVTLGANDFVCLSMYGVGSSFSQFQYVAFSGVNATIAWKRGSSWIKSATTASTSYVNLSGVFIDKPGVGTFTYTITLSSSGATAGVVAQGELAMWVVRA